MGVWKDYRFVIDPNLTECDYWVVFTDYRLGLEKCECNKKNIIFMPGEGRSTSTHYSTPFLNQFGKIVTVQRQLTGTNVTYSQNALPWFIERTFDELITPSLPKKIREISIISSNKTATAGHRRRLAFAKRLKAELGNRIDFFGRGIIDFKDKTDVTEPYKYHIAIENEFCKDLVTEKFFDPILTYTLPIYFGCPNLENYIEPEAFVRIDINDFSKSLSIILKLLGDQTAYERHLKSIVAARRKYLSELQFFPAIVQILESMDNSLPKTMQLISADARPNLLSRLKRRINARLG